MKDGQIEPEWRRIQDALEAVKGLLRESAGRHRRAMGRDCSDVFLAHAAMLSDPQLAEDLEATLRKKRFNAERVVVLVFQEWIRTFRAAPSVMPSRGQHPGPQDHLSGGNGAPPVPDRGGGVQQGDPRPAHRRHGGDPGSVALGAGLRRQADFLCAGTNDPTRYVMTADRESALVNGYFQDDLPVILGLLEIIVEEAGNTPVTLCSELAAKPESLARVLGTGVRSLSDADMRVPEVKAAIRGARRK